MAGLYRVYEGKPCYVILTTAANPSVADVHERMPLVLLPDQIDPWLEDAGAALSILHRTPRSYNDDMHNEADHSNE